MLQRKYLMGYLAAGLLMLSSCEKETTKDVSRTYKVPEITLNGAQYISVEVGSTYTDEGAVYTKEDGTTADIEASVNEVNTSAPGLFFVQYEEESESGLFHTVATRIVAVAYRTNPVDRSGSYLREATGMTATISKLAPGLYRLQNPGGATGAHTGVVMYFIESALNTYIAPRQPNDLIGDIDLADMMFTDTGASWRIPDNQYYGTGVRTFVKQ